MPGDIVIFDSEWTSWEGAWARGWSGPGEAREIVQIGMAKLHDGPELPEIATLDCLVRPKLNPDLSDYFINLTGITQHDVDTRAVTFPEAYEKIIAFVGEGVDVVYSFGMDGPVLTDNCAIHDLALRVPLELFCTITPKIAHFVGLPDTAMVSSRLPEVMNFTPPGDAHTALADARCIAEALRIMRRAGAF